MNTSGWATLVVVGVLLAIVAYGIPTLVAFSRRHEYRWIIFAVNLVLGVSGIGWLIALIWAIWPSNKSLADPVIGNPTGIGNRNVGHAIGDVQVGMQQTSNKPLGDSQARPALEALNRLAALVEAGHITQEEFAKKKATLLQQI